ncbi:zinc finger protein 593 homolog [Cylas formicarius]|uniref:zinc finger protein 593 homolog n=1 Tax=Cylas formicarius TaxID=197179 RepID=UPI002958BCFB|nr:zinc finger protein 593 homolog [Cylas formicarius]
MVYKRKKYNSGDTNLKKKYKTKRRTRDLDEIHEDLKPHNSQQLLKQEIDLDKPGNAQFYCIHCARYFINSQALQEHFTTKLHKRRLKALQEEPYSIKDSERAAGLGSWKPPGKRKIESQQTDSDSVIKKTKVEQ